MTAACPPCTKAGSASDGTDAPAGHHRHGRDHERTSAIAALASARGTLSLRGSVGPGYTISLTKNGHKVESLRAGAYRFVIADRASVHNFVLERAAGASSAT